MALELARDLPGVGIAEPVKRLGVGMRPRAEAVEEDGVYAMRRKVQR